MSEYEQVIDEIVKHGVVVKINKVVDDNYIPCERKYVGCVVELDFSEHDNVFKDEIERLKRRIEKLASIRTRCHESARDSFDSGNYGCLHIVTADELKTTKDVNDRTVELPFDALETANMLINAKNKRKNCMTGKIYNKYIYDIDDLEQIAEHLLVYCKHNMESEE